MEKKLVVVGNGLAFFIDKAMQQLLGFRPDTLVDVTTDGVRLTIEPCGVSEKKRPRLEPWNAPAFVRVSYSEDSEERMHEYNAPAVLTELLARGLTDEHMLRLQHRYWPIEMYRAQFNFPGCRMINEHDREDFNRFEVCLQAVRDGADWDRAIDVALEQVPIRKHEPWFRQRMMNQLQSSSRCDRPPTRSPVR